MISKGTQHYSLGNRLPSGGIQVEQTGVWKMQKFNSPAKYRCRGESPSTGRFKIKGVQEDLIKSDVADRLELFDEAPVAFGRTPSDSVICILDHTTESA